jgi:LysR family hydrogen peroxide-inducible transcriptional activator
VLPCSANSEKYRSRLLKVVPFAEPAPARRVALAWRKSFGREKAVGALAAAIAAVKTPCLRMLG